MNWRNLIVCNFSFCNHKQLLPYRNWNLTFKIWKPKNWNMFWELVTYNFIIFEVYLTFKRNILNYLFHLIQEFRLCLYQYKRKLLFFYTKKMFCFFYFKDNKHFFRLKIQYRGTIKSVDDVCENFNSKYD